MPETKRCLKVFVGFPGDVAAERDTVSEVITRLNSQLEQIYFEAVRWEWHPHARDTRQTPQAAIADRNKGIPRPGECEVAVFIFWTRIGTVLDMTGLEVNGAGDQATGTTWEFFDALESDKPQVLTYRKMAPPPYNRLELSDAELAEIDEQEGGVRRLFNSLRGPNGEFSRYTHPFYAPVQGSGRVQGRSEGTTPAICHGIPKTAFPGFATISRNDQTEPQPRHHPARLSAIPARHLPPHRHECAGLQRTAGNPPAADLRAGPDQRSTAPATDYRRGVTR